jgi:gliding motility-associated-like protein
MSGVKTILFYFFICCIAANATAQSFKENDTYTASQLVENILVNSSCATIMNPLATVDNYSGSKKSFAYFNAGTSTLPFKEGVLLSTWSSQNSVGPFVRNSGGGDYRWSGDSDLEQALNLNQTFNATVLEFDFARNENSITIEFSGIGDHEFSIDGDFFQDNSTFDAVAPGEYVLIARDKNGCGLSLPFITYVLDYPRYFTPNNDGYNDVWKIKNLDTLPKSTLHIFDSYGQLLKQLTVSSNGWNGIFNGSALPADDYWFHLNLENGRTIKGHISLKR